MIRAVIMGGKLYTVEIVTGVDGLLREEEQDNLLQLVSEGTPVVYADSEGDLQEFLNNVTELVEE